MRSNNVIEKTSEQEKTMTDRRKDLSEDRCGSKRTYDDISQDSTELCSINDDALEKFRMKKN